MIIEQDVVDSFLDHHGIKGQKWGIRNTTKTVSRKTKKAAAFVSRHKEGIGTAAAGAAFVGLVLADKNLRAPQHTKSISRGSSWIQKNRARLDILSFKIMGTGF